MGTVQYTADLPNGNVVEEDVTGKEKPSDPLVPGSSGDVGEVMNVESISAVDEAGTTESSIVSVDQVKETIASKQRAKDGKSEEQEEKTAETSTQEKQLPAKSTSFRLFPVYTPVMLTGETSASMGIDIISGHLRDVIHSTMDHFATYNLSFKHGSKSSLFMVILVVAVIAVSGIYHFDSNQPSLQNCGQTGWRVKYPVNTHLQKLAETQAQEITRLKNALHARENEYKSIFMQKADEARKYKSAFEDLKLKTDTKILDLEEAVRAAKDSNKEQKQHAAVIREQQETFKNFKEKMYNEVQNLQRKIRKHKKMVSSEKAKYENEKRRVLLFQRAVKNLQKDFDAKKRRHKNVSSFDGLEKYAKQLKDLYTE